jgi:hypothetical protein
MLEYDSNFFCNALKINVFNSTTSARISSVGTPYMGVLSPSPSSIYVLEVAAPLQTMRLVATQRAVQSLTIGYDHASTSSPAR